MTRAAPITWTLGLALAVALTSAAAALAAERGTTTRQVEERAAPATTTTREREERAAPEADIKAQGLRILLDRFLELSKPERESRLSETMSESGPEATRRAVQAEIERSERPQDRSAISLSYANALVRESETSKEADLLRESLPYYQYVWEHGDAREVLVARSNYAAASVRLGEGAAALEAYQDGYPIARRIDDASVRSRYIANFARLTEAEVGVPEALPLYLEAFESDPTYPTPALFGVRAAVKSGLYQSAHGLLARLFDNGHVQAGGAEITSLLAQHEVVSWPGSDAIAEALFDYLAAARPGFDEFAKTLQPLLEENLDAMAPNTRARVNLVLLSYVGGDKLPRIISPPDARGELTPWIHDPWDSRQAAVDLAAASRFVTTAGELHARTDRLDDALTRYLLAWALDTTNLSAALYAANLLLDHAEALDPDGRWLDQFVLELFEGKGEAYIGEDWPAIYRFHTVLGTIFWRQQNWGSSGQVRSAVFQLEHALSAKDRIRDRRERAAPVGRLHLMLADAYAGIGNNAEAFDSYVRAVREGLARDDRETAEEALARVQVLDFVPPAEDRRMLDEIRLRLRRS